MTDWVEKLQKEYEDKVLGAEEHRHYRVRWTDEHESIFFPSEGTHIRRAERETDD